MGAFIVYNWYMGRFIFLLLKGKEGGWRRRGKERVGKKPSRASCCNLEVCVGRKFPLAAGERERGRVRVCEQRGRSAPRDGKREETREPTWKVDEARREREPRRERVNCPQPRELCEPNHHRVV